MGLNESYIQVRGNILMINPTPTFSQVYSLLVQEERQRQVKSSAQFQGEGASFNASTASFNQTIGQRKKEGRRSQLFCTHCKRSGHAVEKCYKIHGHPSFSKQGGRPRSFRSANNVCIDAEKTEEPVATPSLLGLNQEQSRQLFQFVTNLITSGSNKQEGEEATTSTAYMAGIS